MYIVNAESVVMEKNERTKMIVAATGAVGGPGRQRSKKHHHYSGGVDGVTSVAERTVNM